MKYALILLICSPCLLIGQSTNEALLQNNKTNYIYLEKGVSKLINKEFKIRKKSNGLEGYCVQIYNGQSREDAQKIKYQFMKKFPKITSVTYERVNPNWKVRVGQFRTKIEAEKLENSIKTKYPFSFVSKLMVPVGEFD
ncbi:MAG: hypothetical protein CMP51_04465 [Flavobacteriales bacterium]|nr:hypothetical protein [Flavobacteriales bacterium]